MSNKILTSKTGSLNAGYHHRWYGNKKAHRKIRWAFNMVSGTS